MPSARERVKALAQEIKKAIVDAQTAEARVDRLGEELMHALTEARVEAETARTIIEYPVGRYECKQCRHSTIFSEPYRELPACDNCGSREYSGAEPKVTTITPPPMQYSAGMYECTGCGGRTVVVDDTDTLPPCELCGAGQLTLV